MDNIRSNAFENAALRSESFRILGLLALSTVLLIYTIARGAAERNARLIAAQSLLVLATIGYEAFMLMTVGKAIKDGRRIPAVLWFLNVLIEPQLPTLALVVLMRNNVMTPFQVLIAPAMLIYFFFVILSTLRLSPALSILTGATSALGYAAVVTYTFANFNPDPATFPVPVYVVYATLIFTSGLLAAFVAGQIRAHVLAALREAELERELDRVNHDLDTARTIQQSLLPTTPPVLADFEIAGWNQPADQTGGDYFDWQELPDGRVAISLADATGHGIGPALIGTSCRAYARASLLNATGRNGVLSNLNQLLSDDLPSNRFVTFAVIFLDPANARVQILSAGHGPILWYRHRTDTVDSLDAHGIPLGMMPGAEYGHATEGHLEKGDSLALVTDGFFEWEDPDGEQFGTDRLERVLREARGLPPEEVITRLRTAVETFCRGTAQNDDLTVVILRRNDS